MVINANSFAPHGMAGSNDQYYVQLRKRFLSHALEAITTTTTTTTAAAAAATTTTPAAATTTTTSDYS